MLVINHLTKTFKGKKILDDLTLQVNEGEIAVLLGASGVGKSTLLRILNNLEQPDSGIVMLDGKTLDLTTVNNSHLVGMVFQQFNLFDHLTAQENIAIVLRLVAKKSAQEADAIALQLLNAWGLGDKATVYPINLSGGQKQRLALARTLALKPRIICLDEPTSALDPMLTHAVATTIQDLATQGYIILVATHDTSLLERLRCTIHLMSNGRIIESAPSQDLFISKQRYQSISSFISGDTQ
ncbi:ATP-binding cassette domain-containing protein [Candidatus Dependentiae bacterium]|nr:ATP-binding cassette domain-containing protein [Candidatus Dependentiae bacterium]